MSNWIVILAAGESRRFKEAGYDKHKPALILKDHNGVEGSMIFHVQQSVSSLVPEYGLLSVLPKNCETPEDLIGDVAHIKHTTGQAHTLYQIIKQLPPNDRVLVLDCDMILQASDIAQMLGYLWIYDVVIAVTETFDPNASRIDQIPYPTLFVEKEPISAWGMVAARGFNKIGILVKALEDTLSECVENKVEPYLSMAINHYPGLKYAHKIDKYIDLGTPERVRESGWQIIKS